MAQDLVAAGFDLAAIMQAGRWQSAAMVARYTAAQQAERGAVAQFHARTAERAEDVPDGPTERPNPPVADAPDPPQAVARSVARRVPPRIAVMRARGARSGDHHGALRSRRCTRGARTEQRVRRQCLQARGTPNTTSPLRAPGVAARPGTARPPS
jgi:hypothetical protein